MVQGSNSADLSGCFLKEMVSNGDGKRAGAGKGRRIELRMPVILFGRIL